MIIGMVGGGVQVHVSFSPRVVTSPAWAKENGRRSTPPLSAMGFAMTDSIGRINQ